MRYEHWLAKRFLKVPGQRLYRTSHILAIIGTLIGVCAILVVSAVMNGLEEFMTRSVTDMKSHIHVYQKDHDPIPDYRSIMERIDSITGVTVSTPVCRVDLVLRKNRTMVSTICYGIDKPGYSQATNLEQHLQLSMSDPSAFEQDGLILGYALSEDLVTSPYDRLNVMSPIPAEPTPFGLLPRSAEMRVYGILQSPIPDYDRLYTYIPLKRAQFFLGYGDQVNFIAVRVKDADDANQIAAKIGDILGNDFDVYSWSEFDSNLFSSIQMEKTVMMLALSLMFILVFFNMTGNFIKIAADRRSDIGILKAIGGTNRRLSRIFTYQGLMIGLWGTIPGLALAGAFFWLQLRYGFVQIPVPGFPLKELPVAPRILEFVLVGVFSITISAFSGMYPARKILRTEPVKIIRDS